MGMTFMDQWLPAVNSTTVKISAEVRPKKSAAEEESSKP